MDSTETTLVEFCAGYGGIGIGIGRVIENLRTIALCEIEGFAIENLIAKMEAGRIDQAPVWNDLKTFPSKQFHGLVDILSAGFPCQPFSCAGLRRADDDPRHLFPYIMQSVESIRPRFVFLENVEGLISAKLGSDCWADPIGTPVLLHVCRELERRGYTPTWGVFSASETGAPHQRKRVFILAHDQKQGLEGYWNILQHQHRGASIRPEVFGGTSHASESIPDELADKSEQRLEGKQWAQHEGGGVRPSNIRADELAHSSSEGLQGLRKRSRQEGREAPFGHIGSCSNLWPSRPGEPQYGWEPPRVTGGMENTGFTNTMGEYQRREEPRRSDASRPSSGREEGNGCEAQSTMGGDADGASGGMDYAELCESCDNRVDELRLLGNGVVPATAAKAWTVLYERLIGRQACA